MSELVRAGPRRTAAPVVEEYLAFELCGKPHAVPVAAVREILRLPPLTRVPRAPRAILGIVSVRGLVVTVVSTRSVLGYPVEPPKARARILLVHAPDGEPLGFLVDEVRHVLRLTPDEIEPVSPTTTGDVGDAIVGLARPAALAAGATRRKAEARSETTGNAPTLLLGVAALARGL